MKALLYTDNTFPLSVTAMCELVNRSCRTLNLKPGSASVRITQPVIVVDQTLRDLARITADDAEGQDYVFICTSVPYENNFFFEAEGRTIVFSFFGWNQLTSLPVSNGLVYFLASVLADPEGESAHDENTGCVNDFWWDKRGVDVGMRAAFICEKCKAGYTGDLDLLSDAERLLDLVSAASRVGRDVLTIEAVCTFDHEPNFDVFLCHNSVDKPAVRDLNRIFAAAGIRTWFDEEQLEPGLPWQLALEQQISKVRSACVFVGSASVGPWQQVEVRAFLAEFVNRGCPVIPVLLPGAGPAPKLPIFLSQMMWVDLRESYHQNLAKLLAACSGRRRA